MRETEAISHFAAAALWRGFGLALCLAVSIAGAAAQTAVPRVGFLCWVTCGDVYHQALWQGLRKLGYADYRNIAFENRAAGGDAALLDMLAADLVSLAPAVIIADTTQSARALKRATATIPLVVIADDPVGSGLISNLPRPEANLTGLSSVAVELGAKQLQLLKEIAPQATRIGVIGNPDNPATGIRLQAMEAAARALGVMLIPFEVRTPSQHENAFRVLAQRGADSLIDILGAADRSNSATTASVLQLAMRHRLPVVYQGDDFVAEGGLMSYGPSLRDEFARAAIYVDRILKGAKPADLPVEQPTRFALTINLKTAKALGLTIPPSLLARADEVIE